MGSTTVNTDGKLTIPVEVRAALGLKPGDPVRVYVEGDHAAIEPARYSVRDLKGMVPWPSTPVAIEAMKDAAEREATERNRQ